MNVCLSGLRRLGIKTTLLSVSIVQTNADKFVISLGKSYFKASAGWLQSFKESNSITFKSVCSESGSIIQKARSVWKK